MKTAELNKINTEVRVLDSLLLARQEVLEKCYFYIKKTTFSYVGYGIKDIELPRELMLSVLDNMIAKQTKVCADMGIEYEVKK